MFDQIFSCRNSFLGFGGKYLTIFFQGHQVRNFGLQIRQGYIHLGSLWSQFFLNSMKSSLGAGTGTDYNLLFGVDSGRFLDVQVLGIFFNRFCHISADARRICKGYINTPDFGLIFIRFSTSSVFFLAICKSFSTSSLDSILKIFILGLVIKNLCRITR